VQRTCRTGNASAILALKTRFPELKFSGRLLKANHILENRKVTKSSSKVENCPYLQAGHQSRVTIIYHLLAAKTVMFTIILWGSDSLSSTHKERASSGLLAFFKAYLKLQSN
jgi:hypothetical protein